VTRRSQARPPKLRVCVRCGAPLPERRPVFLVGHPSGRIVGPFHAGCAEGMTLDAKRHAATLDEVIGETYGDWPSRREETLPW
jgi:hypothetical protein